MIDYRRMVKMKKEYSPKKEIKYGIIDPAYESGRPKVIVDGTDLPSEVGFLRLDSYIPVANDRVMIIKDVIVGKIV